MFCGFLCSCLTAGFSRTIRFENKTSDAVHLQIHYSNGRIFDRKFDDENPQFSEIAFWRTAFRDVWTTNNIKGYVSTIDSIKITSNRGETVLDNKEDMYHFFRSHRRSFPNRRDIRIVFD